MDQPARTTPPIPSRADALLADRYETMCGRQGQSEAARDLREVLELGVEKVMERTQGKALNDAQRFIVDAVRAGRVEVLVQELSAGVRDLVRERTGAHLTAIRCRHGALSFLPDVLVPASEENAAAWKTFLDSLEAKCLRVEDPLTRLRGRIPFRDGVWFADMIFIPDASVAVPPSVTEIHGNLMLRGNRPATRHRLAVHGALYADTAQLMTDAFVSSLTGPMRLYSETEKTAEALSLPPEAVTAWGAGHGASILLNDRSAYRLHVQDTPEGVVHALVECPGGKDIDLKSMRWVWRDTRWKRFARELPPETAYALLRKFRRICAVLGLGEDFIEEHRDTRDTIDANAQRMDTLLALGRGDHSPRAARDIPEEHRRYIAEMRQRLERLRDLAVGEGPEFYRDMELVAADIGEILEEFSDGRLNRLKTAMTGQCPRIDRRKLKADSAYLRDLAEGGLNFGDVLGTAGRTLVFVNNVCTSKQARSLAAETIAMVRRDLKSVLGGKVGQDVLLNLLKFSDEKAFAKLKRTYGDRGGAVPALVAHLKDLNERTPLEVLRDFRRHPYRTVTPELDADRALLGRCLSLGRGTLNEMFTDAPPGDGLEDGRLLQNALMVNMRSFLADDVRLRPLDLNVDAPSSLVEFILAKVDRYRAVVPEFNRVCAAGDEADD